MRGSLEAYLDLGFKDISMDIVGNLIVCYGVRPRTGLLNASERWQCHDTNLILSCSYSLAGRATFMNEEEEQPERHLG